jgi:hypothetical protein
MGGLFALLLVGIIWPLLSGPWIFSGRGFIDITSGDLRDETIILGIRVTNTVSESEFSTEVRRLGIPIPGKPVWMRTHWRGLTGRHSSFDYAEVVYQSRVLVTLLDVLKASDDDRKLILTATLDYLQRGQIAAIDEQVRALESRLPE